jgi:hypothetical protein
MPKIRLLGRAYLAQMYRRYGNWPDAIAAYNWGPGNLDTWIIGGRLADEFPIEVEHYRDHVLHDAAFVGRAAMPPRAGGLSWAPGATAPPLAPGFAT